MDWQQLTEWQQGLVVLGVLLSVAQWIVLVLCRNDCNGRDNFWEKVRAGQSITIVVGGWNLALMWVWDYVLYPYLIKILLSPRVEWRRWQIKRSRAPLARQLFGGLEKKFQAQRRTLLKRERELAGWLQVYQEGTLPAAVEARSALECKLQEVRADREQLERNWTAHARTVGRCIESGRNVAELLSALGDDQVTARTFSAYVSERTDRLNAELETEKVSYERAAEEASKEVQEVVLSVGRS